MAEPGEVTVNLTMDSEVVQAMTAKLNVLDERTVVIMEALSMLLTKEQTDGLNKRMERQRAGKRNELADEFKKRLGKPKSKEDAPSGAGAIFDGTLDNMAPSLAREMSSQPFKSKDTPAVLPTQER